jgi:Zn-dependent alcohol dehydrogenase
VKIRAAVLDRPGVPLAVGELDLAPPRAGEVLVRIVAAGACRSDLHIIKGVARDPLPAVLGHEGAGIIEAVGPGITGGPPGASAIPGAAAPSATVAPGAATLVPGQPVLLAWTRGCGECRICRAGRPQICFEGIAEGALPAGGSRLSRGGIPVHHSWGVSCFATHAVIPQSMVIPVPPGTDLETAAILGCAVATGVGAVLNTARVAAGSSAAVIGCGGVGLSILQALRMVGARPIVAVDRGAARLQAARAAGATAVVDIGGPVSAPAGRPGPGPDGPASAPRVDPIPAVLELTCGGADHVFEAVGLPATVQQAAAMLGPGGAAILVGMPAEGARVDLDLNALWSGERRLVASVYGSSHPRDDFPRLLRLVAEGRIDPGSIIRRRYPLDRINEAFADLDSDLPGRGIVVMDSVETAVSGSRHRV